MKLSRWTRIYIWFRLFLLQASWNFERLQGLGFFYAILPGLKKLYPRDRLPQVARQHTEYFNTHPYLAPLVAGAVLKMEEERACQPDMQVDIGEFKELVAAPYAAIGDALFWGGVRPLAAGLALLFAAKGIVWTPVIFLLFFNIVPFVFRVSGFIRGYSQGIHSVDFVQRHHLPDWAIHTKEAAVVVLGGFSAFWVFQHLHHRELADWLGLLVLIPVLLVGMLARKGISTLLIIFLSSIAVFLFSLFWTDMTNLINMWRG